MKMKKIALLLVAVITILLGTTVYATSDVVVILDPGHGGTDSGAVGGNLVEKTVTWKIAERVKEILDSTPGITGYLTREENENPSLYERGLMAKEKGADLLVSFHINSSNYVKNFSGAETYITANTNSTRFYQSSKKLGEDILANLKTIGISTHNYMPIRKYSNDGELYTDGFLSDYYGIIRNPMYYGIPGVLIEHCYINNEYDRINYLNDDMLNKIAEQDAKAIITNKELFRINKENNAINASLDNIVVNDNNKYIQGELTAIDWTNGMQCIPSIKVRLKSTDGTYTKECFVNPLGGYRFYFDVHIEKLDWLKEYILEIESLDKVNIPTRHTITLSFSDKTIGKINGYTAKCSENKIVFDGIKYEGNINTELTYIRLESTDSGKQYLSGDLIIVEWINGMSNIPNPLPKMTLVATDSTKQYKINLIQENGHIYTFYTNENETIDTSKQYEIIIESTNRNNIAEGKKGVVRITDREIGMYSNYKIKTKENKLIFALENYEGEVSTDLLDFNLIKTESGADYITGNILIDEFVGDENYVPFARPKMTLIDEDENEVSECYVSQIEGRLYYFDRNITGINSSKKYSIKVELTENNNVSTLKAKNVNFGNYSIKGKLDNYNLIAYDEIIEVTKKYHGDVNSEVIDIQYTHTDFDADYITGEVVIVEWVNGISTVPSTLPRIVLETASGEYLGDCYVNQIDGHRYYFDKNITGIDKEKMYRLKIILTEPDNVSENNTMIMNFKEGKTLTTMGEYRLMASGLVIHFNNNYKVNINSEVKYIELNETAEGRKYISGNVVIVEWVNYFSYDTYVSKVPMTLPKMTLKDEDGNSYPMFLSQVSGHLYYFDRFIDGLDTNKKYYIELELTEKGNVIGYKKMNLYFGQNENFVGEKDRLKMYTKQNEIKFESIQ